MAELTPFKLDSDEQALLSDYDAGMWSSVDTPGVFQPLREAARATGQKDQLDIQAARRTCTAPTRFTYQLIPVA